MWSVTFNSYSIQGFRILKMMRHHTVVTSLCFAFGLLFLTQIGCYFNGLPLQPTAQIPIKLYNSLLNHSGMTPNCNKLFQGDAEEIFKWKDFNRPAVLDKAMHEILSNCSNLKSMGDYPQKPRTAEEEKYPIAYSISIHTDVYQTERLLRMIYAPQNVYCIHVDAKAAPDVHKAAVALANCFKNVFIASNLVQVHWGTFSVIKAVLNCMHDLVKFPKWKYFINLAGQDVPLKTNLEIVRILKVLNGSNDVELRPELEFSRYWFKHKIVHRNQSKMYAIPDYRSWNLPVPFGFRIYKGNLASTLSKPFVQFVLNNEKSKALTNWLSSTSMADEHLWSTLNHQSSIGVPGGYPDKCHDWAETKSWLSRFVIWRDEQMCHGKLIHDVCVLGVGDLQTISEIPQLFVNKLYSDYQSAALDCLQERLILRRDQAFVDLNLHFYGNMQGVKLHNWKINNEDKKRLCPASITKSIVSSPPEFKKMIRSKIIQI